MYFTRLMITNKTGLHARPAARFVAEAAKYKSKIMVTNMKTGESGNAKSMIKTISLAISAGTEISIEADGPDETEAVSGLAALVESGFGES